jgi:hypothetical protein
MADEGPRPRASMARLLVAEQAPRRRAANDGQGGASDGGYGGIHGDVGLVGASQGKASEAAKEQRRGGNDPESAGLSARFGMEAGSAAGSASSAWQEA